MKHWQQTSPGTPWGSYLIMFVIASWWRRQIKTFSSLPDLCEGNPPITGGFPSQRPLTRSFEVCFYLRLKKRLITQSRRRWLETPPRKYLTKGQWIPLTKGQQRGKYFHLMTSSCHCKMFCVLLWFSSYVSVDCPERHYYDVIMGAMAYQITSLTIVYLTAYWGSEQKKTSKLRVKWPVKRKMFPFDDVITGVMMLDYI